MTSSTERLESIVHGMVQGVGFRWFVVRAANRHGLVGWVANQPDGTVRVIAEGTADRLDRLEAALASGPPGARVTSVVSRRSLPAGGLATFEVRAGGHRGD